MPTDIERLYREHRAGLVRLVERELHDHHDAEDVVQTAFLDAQRALERGTTPRNPHAWLAAIALNAGRRLRRRRLNAELLEHYAVQEASRLPEIRAALASLPREQRAAVVYRDVLGLSYGETAEQMGKSVDAVTMLLHRGRGRLRQTLGVTTGAIGLWRWLKRAGMPQAAAAKGAAAVVVGAGLATSGIVAARVIAPIGTGRAAPAIAPAAATRSGDPTERTGSSPDATRVRHRARGRVSTAHGSSPSTTVPAASASTGVSGRDAAAAPVRSSTAEAAQSRSPSIVRLPTVSLPTLSVPTVAATVSTPITTITVTVPTGTTVTVATPITTVTLPIP